MVEDFKKNSKKFFEIASKITLEDEYNNKLCAFAIIDAYKNLLDDIATRLSIPEPEKLDIKTKKRFIQTKLAISDDKKLLETVERLRNNISHSDLGLSDNQDIIILYNGYKNLYSDLVKLSEDYLKKKKSLDTLTNYFNSEMIDKLARMDKLYNKLSGYGGIFKNEKTISRIEGLIETYNKEFEIISKRNFSIKHYKFAESITMELIELEDTVNSFERAIEDYGNEQLADQMLGK